jgi:serine/threonine protein kinase
MNESLFEGRYEFIDTPKLGGMSIVQKVRERDSGLIRALKCARDDVDPRISQASFDAELRALSSLKHKNIVVAYDQGITADRRPYLVLEWLPETLEDISLELGGMTWDVFYTDFGRPILDALRYSHNRHTAHRDLKPRNILLGPNKVPKIADFGIARWMDKVPVGMTLRGAGSLPYTPPDQDDGVHSYGRDCYSWATIAVGCLIGKKFTNLSEFQSGLSYLDKDAAPVDALIRATALDPKSRYSIAAEMACEVESFHQAYLVRNRPPIEVPLYFPADCLRNCLNAWELNDLAEAKNRLLTDLNESGIASQLVGGSSSRIEFSGARCSIEAEVMEPAQDRLRVIRANVISLTSAVHAQESLSPVPFVTLTDKSSASPELRRRAIKDLVALLLDDVSRIEAERLEAERQRFYSLCFGFLREKERYYKDQSIKLSYRNFRRDGALFVANLEGEIDLNSIGDSLIVQLPNGRPVAFRVLDVQVEIIRLELVTGPVDSVPRAGVLQTNRIAELRALAKQRIAVEALQTEKAVSPILGLLMCEPANARAPEPSGLPPDIQHLSQDKHAVLDKALGIQDILVVEGPPGTGKTTLIAELIDKYLKRFPDRRVILSSQTHVAVDHIIVKLREKGLDDCIVRIAKSQEEKVDRQVAPLLLQRKLEAWINQAQSRSRQFIEEYAERVSVNSQELRAGILGRERAWRLTRIRDIEAKINELKIKEDALDSRRKLKVEENEQINPDEVLDETTTIADEVVQLDLQKEENVRAEAALRHELIQLGDYGQELAGASEGQVREWVAALLPESDEAKAVIRAIDLHHKWIERLGVSSAFLPAVIGEAKVVAGTCVGLASVQAIFQEDYDLSILDEASKATVTEALIPMARSRSWVLVGDPKQLPPFFDSGAKLQVDGFTNEEVRASLLDYLLARLPDANKDRLVEQRRMVEGIGALIGDVFYSDTGGLTNARRNRERSKRVAKVFPKPVTWVSTARLQSKEERISGNTYCNREECEIVVSQLRRLNNEARGIDVPISVAVIAGYAGQVRTLKEYIGAIPGGLRAVRIECNTVDAFQGRDADVCIYSVTRTNRKLALGFQREKPRLNVALSRGRDALIIVGDDVFCRACPGENPFPALLDYIDAHPDSCEVRRHDSV